MSTDLQPAEFYTHALGHVTARLLRERLLHLWPDLRGQAVLGMGFTSPYLRLWRQDARCCIALSPAQTWPARWPDDGRSLACMADEDCIPFPDLSFDRVLLLHGLEIAENPRRVLREVWRVLKDDGRLAVVAANRRGVWAHVDTTPFGQGQPFSPGQIGRLLRASLFHVEARDTALFMPPTRWRLILRGAGLWESTGRRIAPRLAGVTITEAVKDVYAAMPVAPVRRRRLMLADISGS